MRIAVNTRLLMTGKLEGIGWFTFETLKRITRLNPRHEFLFLFDRPFSDEFIFSDNIVPYIVSPQARHPLLWHRWFEYSVPQVLKRTNAGMFISPDGFISLSSSVPSFSVIHDINFMHRADFHPWLTGKYYRYYFPRFAKQAKRIATVSEYSKNDISTIFGIPAQKIDVVFNGAGAIYTPLSEELKSEVKNEIAGGSDYFLYVGSFHERKNIDGLLNAYDRFRTEKGHDIKLLLAGEKMYDYPQMRRALGKMTCSEDVIFTGRMEPPDLQRAYGAAMALVYIPFFEGFGIPLLEAMNCDTPVITSDCTSLPEIAGDAALLVNPYNISSVADGMSRIVTDMNLRKSLIERGRIRKRAFSWDHTAKLLWKSIERAMD